jgi:hypothetical protein
MSWTEAITHVVDQFVRAAIQKAWIHGSERPFTLISVSETQLATDRVALGLSLGVFAICSRCQHLLRATLYGWEHERLRIPHDCN